MFVLAVQFVICQHFILYNKEELQEYITNIINTINYWLPQYVLRFSCANKFMTVIGTQILS